MAELQRCSMNVVRMRACLCDGYGWLRPWVANGHPGGRMTLRTLVLALRSTPQTEGTRGQLAAISLASLFLARRAQLHLIEAIVRKL